MNPLQKVIIERCIEIYSAIADDVLNWWNETLPKELIIIEAKERKRTENSIESYQMCWRFFDGKLEPYSFDGSLHSQPGQKYFDIVLFTFFVSTDGKNAFIEYHVGPRFARGFRYDIVTGDNGRILENEKLIWVS